MAEEIASMFIKIEAKVDEAVKSLDEINNKLTSVEKATAQTAKATEQSFQTLTQSTIDVTATFIKLEQTYSTIQNYQLRLENATEKLANANDRLADAQKNVKRSTEEAQRTIAAFGKNSLEAQKAIEKQEDAEQELIRSQRALTISQNNYTRVQNAALGVYASAGLSLLTVASNAGKLRASFILLGQQLTRLNLAFLTSPIGIAAVGVALITGAVLIDRYKDKQQELEQQLKTTSMASSDTFSGMTQDLIGVAAQIEVVNVKLGKLTGLQDPKEMSNNTAILAINDQIALKKEEIWKNIQKGQDEESKALRASLNTFSGTKEEFLSIQPAVQALIESRKVLEEENKKQFQSQKDRLKALQEEVQNNANVLDAVNQGILKNSDNVYGQVLTLLQQMNEELLNSIGLAERITGTSGTSSPGGTGKKSKNAQREGESDDAYFIRTGLNKPAGFDEKQKQRQKDKKSIEDQQKLGLGVVVKPKGTAGDFLLRSDGTMLKFSPQDHIMGFKDTPPTMGRNSTIVNVQIDVHGSVMSEGELMSNISRHLNQSVFSQTNFI